MKAWKACFTWMGHHKIKWENIRSATCYSLLEILLFGHFLDLLSSPLPQFPSLLYSALPLFINTQASSHPLLMLVKKKIINGKSFKSGINTLYWLWWLYLGLEKYDCLVANSNQIEKQEKEVVQRGSLGTATGTFPFNHPPCCLGPAILAFGRHDHLWMDLKGAVQRTG